MVTGTNYVRLFVTAYPADFLCDLKLNNLVLINNYELSLRACLLRLCRLDLSDSQLDDSHELLSIIPDLASLRVLILTNVPISERGLRRIFLPCLDGRKLPQLAHLDISGTDPYLLSGHLKAIRYSNFLLLTIECR